jgi:hypothetical protein
MLAIKLKMGNKKVTAKVRKNRRRIQGSLRKIKNYGFVNEPLMLKRMADVRSAMIQGE